MEEESSFEKRVRKLNDMIENPEEAEAFIKKGILFQEAFGFSEEQMREFYHFARRLCEEERFQDASDVFLVLTALNPYVCHFWLGLGLCDKIAQNYDVALFDYSMAVAVDRENPYPYYNIADCYKRLGEENISREFIDLCIDRCGEEESYIALVEEAKKFRERIKAKPC